MNVVWRIVLSAVFPMIMIRVLLFESHILIFHCLTRNVELFHSILTF